MCVHTQTQTHTHTHTHTHAHARAHTLTHCDLAQTALVWMTDSSDLNVHMALSPCSSHPHKHNTVTATQRTATAILYVCVCLCASVCVCVCVCVCASHLSIQISIHMPALWLGNFIMQSEAENKPFSLSTAMKHILFYLGCVWFIIFPAQRVEHPTPQIYTVDVNKMI